MRRGRILIFLALILIIGLAVVALVFRQVLIPTPSTSPQTQSATVQVFIAGQNIPQGEVITDDVLSTIGVPQESVAAVMFTENQRADLIGKTARYPIDQGVFITRSMVSDGSIAAGGPEWASQIPQGMTAISIPTSRLDSVAYGVRDGAHVDVNACFLFIDVDPSYQTELPNHISVLVAPGTEVQAPEGGFAQPPGITLGIQNDVGVQGRTEVESAFQQGIYVIPSEPQRPRLVCQMVLQNVAVLKLGTFDLPQEPAAPAEQTDPEAQPTAPTVEVPDVLTLVVTPQDSVTLSYLVYGGAKLTMTLRNIQDESRVATEAATLQFLLSQYNIPVPAKLPYAMQPRIDSFYGSPIPNNTSPTPIPPQ